MNFQNQIDYAQGFGIDIFEGVTVPAPLDAEVVKSHIVYRCGLLIPLYSEPSTMKAAITHWFSYNRWGIEKMVELLKIKYDPLENYHKHESETLWHHGTDTDSGTIGDSRTITEQGTIKDNRTITDTGTISDEGGSTTENTVSAYNSDDYEPDAKQEITNGNERTLDTERSDDNTRTLGTTHKDDNTRTLGTTKTLQNDERNKRETWGNIGTMTTQEMFLGEIGLLDGFNPYEWIVNRIEGELFLGIW